MVTLFAPAPAGGVNVGLSSDNPALVEFPSPIINIPAGQQSLAFTMVTHGVGTPTVVQITATVEGVGQTQVLTLNPATVLDVSVAPTTINGGETSTGIVRLDGEAVAGVQVTLSQTGLHVSIPTFVNFNAGDVQGTFTIMAPPVTAADQTTTITGTLGVSAAATTLVIESNNISAMNLTSTNVLGGTVIDGSITLVRPAAASGFTIPFATDSPALVQFVPTSVTIPPGATSATFQIRTVGMSTTQNATVSCDKDGYNRAIRVITVRALEFGISFAPSTVKGGSPVVATVTLGNGDVAPFGGITMQVSSSAPLTANGPTSITIPAGAGSVTFGITTTVIANDANVVFTAGTVGGVQRTGTLLVKGIALSALSISPTSVLGGISATGTLTLDQNAPTGGFTVNLASSNPGIATVPATVTVPAGQKVVSFVVSTLAVATSQNITITATRGTFVQSASLSVNPSSVQSITFNPATVLGLQSTTATVTLNALAPAGGLTVSLAANRPEFVGFPSSVVVPAGTNSVTFTVTTTQVTRSVGVIFTATSIGNVTATGTLFIDPSTD
ncbi:MAG: hypothetical protein K8R88_04005 [Armatimonadetes bacterium]|nr:hypothetical protein [Armatimonadota bacterium]